MGLCETARCDGWPQRTADTALPVGREEAQIGHVGEMVVVGVAAFPVLRGLPAGGQATQVADVDLSVEAGVAEVGVLAQDGGAVTPVMIIRAAVRVKRERL